MTKQIDPEYLGNLKGPNGESIVFDQRYISRRPVFDALKFASLKLNCFPCKIEIESERDDETYFSYDLLIDSLKLRCNYIYDPTKNLKSKFHQNTWELIEVIKSGVIIFIKRIYEKENLVLSITNNELQSIMNYPKKLKHQIFEDLDIYYKPEFEKEAEEIFQSLKNITMKKDQISCINMVCLGLDDNDDGGEPTQYLYLQPIEIRDPNITSLDLHYGNGFNKIHENIFESLVQENAHGLVLLHGLPGTGKTNYIRYLINQIKDKKKIIYIAPDMIEFITRSDFWPFMLKHKNSILIIEDAENIIKTRTNDKMTSQAISNLLNLTDGLLGDCLYQPVIATFNCELNSIDSALLRSGRLIAQYEFNKLNVENGQILSNQLGFKTTIDAPMTLADIYNQDK